MGAESRLKSFKQLLAHGREQLGLEPGFVLWDGSTVPDDLAPDVLAITLADEGVIASLTRRPNLETFANLWVSGRLDLRNGTIFDLVAARPKMRTKAFRKAINKWMAAKTLAKFLLVPRGGPWPLEEVPDQRPSDGSAAENEKNIQYHYDVSNAFYALWLDKEMVYTCAYCTDWDNDIDQMQQDKLEMICRRLRLKEGEHLLDIGCGWGSVCFHAAQHHGVTAVGVTLSTQQHKYATEKAARLGISDRVKFELADYSEMDGKFDKISAIGIQEHLGINNHPIYYNTVKRLLKKDGLFLHHAITRPTRKNRNPHGKKNRAETALFTKYIFPGAQLDHIGNTVTMLEQYGFEVHDVENWREHYQRTCKLWHDRLLTNYDAAVKEVGEPKTRLWLLYLAASSITFGRNNLRLYQTLASRRRPSPSGLPPTRADLYRDR